MSLQFDEMSSTVSLMVPTLAERPEAIRGALDLVAAAGARSGLTRWCVRLIAADVALAELERRGDDVPFVVEARVPLAGRLAGCSFVFFGRNASGRESCVEVSQAMQRLLDEVGRVPRKSYADLLSVTDADVTVERVTAESCTTRDREQLVAMCHDAFTDDLMPVEAKLDGLLADPARHVLLAARSRLDGELHAVCAGSELTIAVAGAAPCVLWELGKSIKRQRCAGKGLNALLKLRLIERAAAADVDLVFCETRLALRAPNQVNQSLGMRLFGQLPKALRVHGVEDVPEHALDGLPYKTLGVWGLRGPELLRMAGALQRLGA